METNEKDKLLKGFFSEKKQEIVDDGFTQRVMRKLPEKVDRSWIVWVFAAIGMYISLLLGIYFGLIQQTLLLIQHVPIIYLLSGIFSFPLVGSIGFYFTQDKNYRLI